MLNRIDATPQLLSDTTAKTVDRSAAPQESGAVVAQAPIAAPAQPDKVTYLLQQGTLQGSFEYDQQLHQVIIVLRDENTGKTVQQIPSEKIQRMMEGMMATLGKQFDLRG